MLNITNKNIEQIIRSIIIQEKAIIKNSNRMCMVASNLIYNDLLESHIPCKIINTKELGLGYEHEFVIVREKEYYFLIDITYDQFLTKSSNPNLELLQQGYIKVDNDSLVKYLNSIPNTYKINSIDIEEIYLSKAKKMV